MTSIFSVSYHERIIDLCFELYKPTNEITDTTDRGNGWVNSQIVGEAVTLESTMQFKPTIKLLSLSREPYVPGTTIGSLYVRPRLQLLNADHKHKLSAGVSQAEFTIILSAYLHNYAVPRSVSPPRTKL